MILPINIENIPNYKNIIPKLQHADYISKDNKTYGVPLTHGPYGLMYNTVLVKNAPETWNVLWDSEYRNKYTISSIPNFNVFITALALGYDISNIFNFETLYADKRVRNKLEALIKNSTKIWDGTDKADDLKDLSLSAGYGFSIPDLRKKRQIWKIASPEEGTIWWLDSWVISSCLANNPLKKQIAEEWINFTLEPEYQTEVFIKGIASFPVNLSIKHLLTDEEVLEFHVNDPDFFGRNHMLLKSMSKRERNGINYIWSKIYNNIKGESQGNPYP